MKRVVLGFLGFLLLICIPAHAGVLGGKKMIRVYESSGIWCQAPFRYINYDDPSEVFPTNDLATFYATDSTATIFFEVTNRFADWQGDPAYNWMWNGIDNVIVAESEVFAIDQLWTTYGCDRIYPEPPFTAFFDFTQLAADDPRIVFRDSFISSPAPEWQGLWSSEVWWSQESSEKPEFPLAPGEIDGSLRIGSDGGPLKASTSMTLDNLTPGKSYGVGFWWQVSIPSGGLKPDLSVKIFDDPPLPLFDRQRQFGTVSNETSWAYYYIDIPEGSSDLVIELADLTADADLYVRHNDTPTFSEFACAPWYGGTWEEKCSFGAPAPGRWWIGVTNYAPVTIDYTVKAEWRTPLDFYTVSPCRVFDSRGGTGASLTSGGIDFAVIGGACGVPRSAKAVSVNLTVVQPTGNGNLKLWPANLPVPAASSINFAPGLNRANNAILNLATDGLGDLAVLPFVAGEGNVHLIIDVNGYFE